MNIAHEIKSILEFYEAMGIEKIPMNSIHDTRHRRVSEQTGYKIQDKKSCASALTPEQKSVALKALREEIADCQQCKLSKGRTHLVFGEGNPDAEIMFIGEGPGREEDIQARPFVGDAGKLLTRMIEKMEFKREDVYIANIVKCRPPLNRDPEEDEIKTCFQFIQRQIEIISPKVIMSLGRISSHTLTRTKIPITKLRGYFYEYQGIPVMPTFHPAYLLRNQNPKDKWLVWGDAQKVLSRIGR